jgi:5'-nucleotidase
MNLLGLALSGVGNHEFDHGQDELLRLQNGGCHPTQGCTAGHEFTGAQFKFLAANVLTQDGAGPPLFPAYEVRNFDGVQVAFIGMTLEGTGAIVNPAGIGGLRFENEVATANRLVTEIQASGIQAIVILLHEGGYTSGNYDGCDGISGPVVQIAEGLSDAVDVILSGHTHQAYNCVIAGKVVTSAASFGRLVTQVNLVVDPVSGDVTSKEAHNLVVLRDASNAAMDTLVQDYRGLTDAQGNRVVGTLTATLSRNAPSGSNGLSTMGAVIADAELAATQDPVYGGAQIAITNPGGVRADLAYAASGGESGSGQVRYAELFAVEPFGNSLVVMTLTGEQVRFAMEQQVQSDGMGGLTADILQISSGFSYTINTAQPDGSRVAMASLMLNGSPMTATAHYRVAVNSYLAAGGDGFASFVQGTDRVDVMAQLDALVAYFENHSPVSPPALDRIHTQ